MVEVVSATGIEPVTR